MRKLTFLSILMVVLFSSCTLQEENDGVADEVFKNVQEQIDYIKSTTEDEEDPTEEG